MNAHESANGYSSQATPGWKRLTRALAFTTAAAALSLTATATHAGATPASTASPASVAVDVASDMLYANESLWTNGTKTSRNGVYTLIMQTDGNLVLYATGGRPIWASKTVGTGANRVIMQSDGNLVIYSPTRAVWASNTPGSGANRLVVQDDGNLVTYSPTRPVWASQTAQGSATVSSGGPFGAAIVNLARAELNRPVHETQADWSPRINDYQATTGAYRVAWCASFVTWLGANAGDRTPFRSAGVGAWYSAAANRQSGLSFVSRNDARPGDLVAFEWSGGTNFAAHGHIGVLTSTVASNGSFQTIEGNTTISGTIQGVGQKTRYMGSTVKAFIRINS